MKSFLQAIRKVPREGTPRRRVRHTNATGFYTELGASVRKYEERLPPKRPVGKFDLVSVIDEMIAACSRDSVVPFICPAREASEREKFVVHPSQSSGCKRKLAFSILEAPRDVGEVDTKQERIFHNGHAVHQRVQGYLFEAWHRELGDVTRVWEDVKIEYPELRVAGELDAVVEVRNKHRYLVEVKSASRSSYDGLRGPLTSWMFQVYLYMAAIGLKDAIVLVECKDTQRMKQFYIPWDSATWDMIEQHIEEVLEMIADKELPPMDKSDCYWCSYKRACIHKLAKWENLPFVFN